LPVLGLADSSFACHRAPQLLRILVLLNIKVAGASKLDKSKNRYHVLKSIQQITTQVQHTVNEVFRIISKLPGFKVSYKRNFSLKCVHFWRLQPPPLPLSSNKPLRPS